ncbi:prenyltransferase/squalene oxidase repeat-containing protein [Cryptosporangium aurantiacum]|uniref:Prenyltransferase and squalene oxidase repeat-containing protein n=1 Tax=Cryptosporangium aurantiacum TaxID=134849 RepID=A0A1M7RLQ8_9ACTN|nr:prenyltransferase/squalene oxidase repeat-containing protein [Cryptosporangium aurantiacum]SHN47111.1 Prenyltransferase and squalene oxidase repeat-containing protein [Cryptosporangium aurantiacum]
MSDRRGTSSLDFGEIDACVERALELLRHTYRSGPGGAGWYHRLDVDQPGPSATAAGLAAFLVFGREFDALPAALAFLSRRQITAADAVLDGGWAVNTSVGRPVTEATSLVTWLLHRARLDFTPDGPDLRRACRWLIANQNSDGGWGSFRGQPSRIWLTAMAIRALTSLEPFESGVQSGVEWLLRNRDPLTRAWGEVPGGPPTVTHTAIVVTTLADVQSGGRRGDVTDALAAGYAWLAGNVRTSRIDDEDARTEEYNVSWAGEGSTGFTWQSTVWHPSLPYALSALTRAPDGVRLDLVAQSVRTILAHASGQNRRPVQLVDRAREVDPIGVRHCMVSFRPDRADRVLVPGSSAVARRPSSSFPSANSRMASRPSTVSSRPTFGMESGRSLRGA